MEIQKKDNTFLYIGSTLAFIFLGVILTTVINNTKPATTAAARAGTTAGIRATGVVAEINEDKKIVVVNQLTYVSNPKQQLGTWAITPPTSFSFSGVIVGNTVSITIDPGTFSIADHTLTAKELKKK